MFTIEEKKQALLTYGYMKTELQRMLNEKDWWDALSSLITLIPDNVGCKTKLNIWEDTMDSAVAAIVDYRRQVEMAIDSLSDWRQKEILKRRYVDGNSWKEIAQMMHLDTRWLLRLHNSALEALPLDMASENL